MTVMARLVSVRQVAGAVWGWMTPVLLAVLDATLRVVEPVVYSIAQGIIYLCVVVGYPHSPDPRC